MPPEIEQFLKEFFQQLNDRSLNPGDKLYVPLYENHELFEDDPVQILARGIEWTPGSSVQLLSGFRGTGKSTELRRLRKRLQDSGYVVVLCDIEDYTNLTTPVDLSDFLLAMAGALGDNLKDQGLLNKDPAHEDYWTRFQNFLTRTKVEFAEAAGEHSGITLKASLKSDPSFKQKLQRRMQGHIGAFIDDIKTYIADCVKLVKQSTTEDTEVVLLMDSIEHIRGTHANASEVHASVNTLFSGHADKLHIPQLHIVYTIPPFLKVMHPNLGSLYDPGELQVLPAVNPKEPKAVEALRELIRKRGDWAKLLPDQDSLDQLITFSGGHLRDLLKLIGAVVRRAAKLPVDKNTVENAINQIRSEFLPIANDDARWLQDVSETKLSGLEDAEKLPDLARFLDTHMILCYRNGKEWYDVHPLIAKHVADQVNKTQSQ